MSELDIKKELWNEKAAKWLKSACTDDYTVDCLADDVNSGECVLFNVYERGQHVASMVLRMAVYETYKELVVVAGGGKWSGGSLYRVLTPFCEKIARDSGAKALRGHCSRAGVGRLMRKAGWNLQEYVYRKEVA